VSESFFQSEVVPNRSQGFTLDFKRVLARAIRFWYIIILSLAISLIIAFYKTRYSQKIYPVSASIVIRETQETSGAELLFKNSLIDPYRNYLNEPYIIKSYPLIEKVIKDLDFDVSFYSEGYFKTSDAYNYLPVKGRSHSRTGKTGTLIFKIKNDSQYSLVGLNEEETTAKTFNFGDTLTFNGFSLSIYKLPGRTLSTLSDVPFLLTVSNPRTLASNYISRLAIDWTEEGSGVIDLTINGATPEKEVDFLSGLISTYSQMDLDKKNETAQRTISFIRKQLLGIKDSLRVVEFQLERFGNSSRLKDMSADAQRLFEKVEVLELQQSELMIRKNYYEYLDEYLDENESNLDQIILPSSVGLTDPLITSLLSKIIDLQLEMKLYLNSENKNNPLVTSKMGQVREIKRDVKEALKTLKSTDKIKSEFLNKQFQTIEKQLALLPASERQLIAVQRNYSLLENLYVFLMQKLSEASISEASNTSDIVVVNPPMKGGIISPNPKQNYILGVLIGLIIPVALFIIFELINNKVQSKEDIDKVTSIPFIGGVGHNSLTGNLTVVEKPKSGLAESFRALRSNLNFFTGNKPKKVFMVSSSISGEGKTFTTINLATVFAMSRKKTLIVGADMRRPKIFQDFNRSNDFGLSTYLSGISDFNEVVQNTDIENLFLVSGGPVPPNPSELLLTNKFDEFIKRALEEFDFVLIDTPPLALVTDAFVMSKFADHTVFVMRQNYSPKEFVKSIDDYYRSGKIKNISILLNDIYKSGLGYGYGQSYDYGYHYGYSYGYRTKSRGDSYYEN
jgi:capsular exopolysaccharide synthesis family protein